MNKGLTPVLVTTSTRGVYFGFADLGAYDGGDVIKLQNFRHIFRWESPDGLYGMVLRGPGAGSKIGPVCPSKTCRNVDGVTPVTADALPAFESATW